MDRRSTLATLIGQKAKSTKTKKVKQSLAPAFMGLEAYTGAWTLELAAHLLKRTTYGPTFADIKQAAAAGLDATVDLLLADIPMPSPPINFQFEEDPNVPIGETWINAQYVQGANLANYRRGSLIAWNFGVLADPTINIREKMTLFWHNHFVIDLLTVQDPKFVYRYITALRENCLGNFNELVKLMTIDPGMLRYLNGTQNTKEAPNENYARELLELFTIGKGPAAGPGDYTNYTEADIQELAKALTGWVARGYLNFNGVEMSAEYINFRHDTSDKQLSHRFDEAVITNGGENEYSDVVDIIFQQEEVSRFICRKLYRWFVYYKIDEDIEQQVIEPMAQILRENNYEVKPAIEALLKSEHFYSIYAQGPMIKNPIDFTMGTFKQFDFQSLIPPNNITFQYRVWLLFAGRMETSQMNYFYPPSVAGWPAYYLEPVYYQHWINSATLPGLMNYTDALIFNGIAFGDQNIKVDVLAFTAQLEDALDPNVLIDEFVLILFPEPITENQKAYLKEILIPGLPDFEWTIEYSDYLADPDNPDLSSSIENKLRNLLKAMHNMPEYFLS